MREFIRRKNMEFNNGGETCCQKKKKTQGQIRESHRISEKIFLLSLNFSKLKIFKFRVYAH